MDPNSGSIIELVVSGRSVSSRHPPELKVLDGRTEVTRENSFSLFDRAAVDGRMLSSHQKMKDLADAVYPLLELEDLFVRLRNEERDN